MKKAHFFKSQIAASVTPPNESELEAYYNTHRDKFSSAPTQMSLVAYGSSSEAKLKEAMANPSASIEGVQTKSMLANSNELPPELLTLINNTAENSFTTPINTGRGYISYLVKSKGTQGQGGFQAVKQQVTMMWIQEHRSQAGQDFFNKLKSNANIRVIRL